MTNQSMLTMSNKLTIAEVFSWIFGIIVFEIGIVNMFWGNDALFGVFIFLLSFVYFLPVNLLLHKLVGRTIPYMPLVKVLLAMFIIWASVGVGELFDKIAMMQADL
ncbi:MAG: hypothetical protein Q7T76_17680 [Ferruginibacter sp.]|nr:hypothetical protein [Ferruginibacter sp.]